MTRQKRSIRWIGRPLSLFFSGQLGEWKWVRNPLSSVNFLWTGESVIAVWNSVDAISVWCMSTPAWSTPTRHCQSIEKRSLWTVWNFDSRNSHSEFFIEILVNVRQNPYTWIDTTRFTLVVLVVRLNLRAPEPPLVYRWKSMKCCVFMWGMESEM